MLKQDLVTLRLEFERMEVGDILCAAVKLLKLKINCIFMDSGFLNEE